MKSAGVTRSRSSHATGKDTGTPGRARGLAAQGVTMGDELHMRSLATGPLAASLATLPILVWTFHEWSPIAPVANAVLTPIMTVLFPLTYLFAVLSFLPTPIADVVAWTTSTGPVARCIGTPAWR